ncbi:DUF4157 domain-containing protein [Phormidium sp. FACHB-592]|nr:DUF4157 domain-containing protein [Phormidium sp. FACHB-592]
MPATQPSVQREAMPEEELQTKPLGSSIQREAMLEEEEALQAKLLAATITPLVQREALPEEGEAMQTKPIGGLIQREALPDEEEALQAKPLSQSIQREALPEEEEALQMKAIGDATLQREAMPEEEEIQTKRSPTPHSPLPTPSLESRLSSSQGGGSPLPDEVRTFMEPRFGADFSQVRVHTGSEAVQMNRDLSAQAFTHKQDVYFGAGKAPAKDALTAHELTHIVQQSGGAVQRSQPHPTLQREVQPAHALQMKPLLQMQGGGTVTADAEPGNAIQQSCSSVHGVIQRKMGFGTKDLVGKPSLTARADKSTFVQIQKHLTDYWGAGNANEEYKHLENLERLTDDWLNKKSTTKKANSDQFASVTKLNQAVKTELPLAEDAKNLDSGYAHLLEVGIPNQYLRTMVRTALVLLVNADVAFRKQDVVTAKAYLKQLRQNHIGDSVNLIESRLFRFYMKVINPELAAVMNDKYQIPEGESEVLSTAENHILDVVNTGLDNMKQKGGEDEKKAKAMEPSHRSLKTKAEAAQTQKPYKKHKLGEIMALTGYTTDFYGDVNTPLRKQDSSLNSKTMSWAKAGISGLNKLPKYEGATYRHTGLIPGYKELNQEGAIVSDLAFSSSATSQAGCASAAKQHDVLEIIMSKTGRDIKDASVFEKGEGEVLFRPGTEFRVVQRMDKNPSGAWEPNRPNLLSYFNHENLNMQNKIQIVILKQEIQ